MCAWLAVLACCAVNTPGDTVLLDFHADWCGPCRAMQPLVAQLESRGVPVRRVNVDQEPALAARYGVGPIPCFVMLVQGREVDRVVGATSIDRLEVMVHRAALDAPPAGAAERRPVHAPQEPPRRAQLARERIDARANPAPPAKTVASPDRDVARIPELLRHVTVRLEATDGQGKSYGSGTVVDRRGGEALVVTCGHIFRAHQGRLPLRVTFFDGASPRETTGRVLSYDLERDVGLVVAQGVGPGPAAPMVPPGENVQPGDVVFAAGCDAGGQPSVHRTQVKALNKYLGPANIVVAGQPAVGRSGGGLFSRDGKLIGVCNAADPQEQEGLYAASSLIHEELAKDQLTHLLDNTPRGGPQEELASLRRHESGVGEVVTAAASNTPAPAAVMAGGPAEGHPVLPSEPSSATPVSAEVICIVRPRNGALAESKVIVLDAASDELLNRIAAEGRQQTNPHWTSLAAGPDPRMQRPVPLADSRPPTRQGVWRPHRP